jgi:hypothetical protein
MTGGDEFLSTGAATLGWAFGASRRGARHTSSGEPCEDALAIWSGSFSSRPCIVAAVADGLGDPACDRAGTGSALAVRSAIDELLAFFQAHAKSPAPQQLMADFRADFPRRVTRRWRSYIAADLETRSEDPGPLCERYGTTLGAALVTDEVILLGQIGDGDIRLVRPGGEYDAPFRPDPELIGSATWSLASRDAVLRWQTAAFERSEGAALLIATDGLPDAFGDGEEYARFTESLVGRIREFGIEQVASSLPGWLDHYSQTGSGDDVTLAIVRINPAPENCSGPVSGSEPDPGWGF